MGNNGQQSAVLHASLMPLLCLYFVVSMFLHFFVFVVCKCFILCDSLRALPGFCAHVGDIVGNHPSLKMMSMCVCVGAIKGVSEPGYAGFKYSYIVKGHYYYHMFPKGRFGLKINLLSMTKTRVPNI